MIKYNSFGDLIWLRIFHYSGFGGVRRLYIDNSCNIYAAGPLSGYFAVRKYSKNGDSLWMKFYSCDWGTMYDMALDKLNNVIVVGSTGRPGNPTGYDFVTIKYNSSGYLFEGTRPSIVSSSSWPLNISYGTQFSISTDLSIDKILLIRPGAPTHAFDQDQRAAFLGFTSGISNGSIPHIVNAPADGNVLPLVII